MNSKVMPSNVKMGTNDLVDLMQEVKETIAQVEVNEKKFTTADLWQIEKNRKSASSYTRKWNLN